MVRIVFKFAISLLFATFAFGCGDNGSSAPVSSTIHDAVANGDLVAVRTLLRTNEKNANLRDDRGFTPLHVASLFGHIEIANLLVNSGADVNAKMPNGATPVYCAAQEGQTEIVKLLSDSGADLDAKAGGFSPMEIAVLKEHFHTKDMLVAKGARITSTPGDADLHEAARAGRIELVKNLLEKAGDVNVRNENCETPLHMAARYGHADVIKLLLAKGSKINDTDKYENTSLHFAADFGDKRTVEILLANGAEVNATNRTGWTPLHFAAWQGHSSVVELLLAKGANINAKERMDGATPIKIADRAHCRDTVELLRRHGAKE